MKIESILKRKRKEKRERKKKEERKNTSPALNCTLISLSVNNGLIIESNLSNTFVSLQRFVQTVIRESRKRRKEEDKEDVENVFVVESVASITFGEIHSVNEMFSLSLNTKKKD